MTRRCALLVLVALLLAAVTGACGESAAAEPGSGGVGSANTAAHGGDAVLAQAFADKATDLEVEGTGTVVRLLADDTQGDAHQRFIVQLASGQTLLVTHNIDIAPRVTPLQVGDTVSFKGVYEWNEQGGLIHWTHVDPDGEHEAGWIEHGGQTYQ
jgi:ABC-type glycerol-3-phosphate transport system substrate-binding protein